MKNVRTKDCSGGRKWDSARKDRLMHCGITAHEPMYACARVASGHIRDTPTGTLCHLMYWGVLRDLSGNPHDRVFLTVLGEGP